MHCFVLKLEITFKVKGVKSFVDEGRKCLAPAHAFSNAYNALDWIALTVVSDFLSENDSIGLILDMNLFGVC
jgi:hypothetical protein